MNDLPKDTFTRRLREGRIALDADFKSDSPVMQARLASLRRYIPGRRPILLFGEPGTGKTAIAHGIHLLSDYKEGPFVRYNTPDTDENLGRSELFGHVKGAFTGAICDRLGIFQLANDGTLFLDEFFEMEVSTQKRVLRVFDSHEVVPVGASKPVHVNNRYIFASNRTWKEVTSNAARWRSDLLSRLGLVVFTMPTLAERIEDLPRLAREYVHDICLKDGRERPPEIHADTLAALAKREYKANLRSLYFTLDAAIPLCDGDVLLPEHLPPVDATEPSRASIRPLAEVQKEHAERALAACDGNVTEAAGLLGIWPKRLLRILARAGGRSS